MIKIIIWIIILAICHALEELEIEGRTKHGWARCLPTKRFNNKIINILLCKELTAYHIFILLMLLIIFHGCYLFIHFNLKIECIIIGLLLYYIIFEDFLWFLLNPCYGIKGFKKGYISWHKRFFCFLPVSYWWGMIIGTGLLILGKR
jgi:hypothetical protein